MTELLARAKINLALVVGPTRPDGRHEVATVLQRISLADRIALEASDELRVEGFAEDTLVGRALEALAAAAGTPPRWHVTIDKQIPVAPASAEAARMPPPRSDSRTGRSTVLRTTACSTRSRPTSAPMSRSS